MALSLCVCQVVALVHVKSETELTLVLTQMILHEVRILRDKVVVSQMWGRKNSGRLELHTLLISIVSSASLRRRSRRSMASFWAEAAPPAPGLDPTRFWKSIPVRRRSDGLVSALGSNASWAGEAGNQRNAILFSTEDPNVSVGDRPILAQLSII